MTGNDDAGWRCSIAVDVGGTFTDAVLVDRSGRRSTTKVPSVPSDPSAGVVAAVHAIAALIDRSTSEVVGACDRFVHGSTVATNAVLTRRLARVGLLTTSGFRDSLEIRRGIRDDQWDHRAPWPPVVVPRWLRRPVRGRIAPDGSEIESIDLDDVRAAADHFEAHGVEAVAISFLHSYRNPAHEQAAAVVLRERWPGATTTVSSDLVPHLGEYVRTSTSVVNAGLVPIVGTYLDRLAAQLADLGLATPLLMLQSNGGTVPVAAVSDRPVDLVLSGPAAVGAATRRLGSGDEVFVTMEIGGTSCDVSVAVGGIVPVVDGLQVGGYHLDVPAVDVHTVGAGGGTIATVDPSGMLQVGPDGAGADPGPACYGKGGRLPTATDAHLALGRLRPGPYADGSIALDERLARQALDEEIGRPLGIDVEAAAIGVLTVLEEHLRHAVETITIQRGRDPVAMTLVAAGGAGGLHGSRVGRMLGCRRLVVPAEAGVFCAAGMLDTELRRDVSRSIVGGLDDIGADGIAVLLDNERDRAAVLVAAEWPAGTRTSIHRFIDLRYPGQMWSVRVPAAGSVEELRSEFEAEYERLYGHVQPGGSIEVTGVGVTVTGSVGATPPVTVGSSGTPEPVESRRCWLGADDGWQDVPVYRGSDLGAGSRLDGPYLVEAATTTVLGVVGDRLVVGRAGDYEVVLS